MVEDGLGLRSFKSTVVNRLVTVLYSAHRARRRVLRMMRFRSH